MNNFQIGNSEISIHDPLAVLEENEPIEEELQEGFSINENDFLFNFHSEEATKELEYLNSIEADLGF